MNDKDNLMFTAIVILSILIFLIVFGHLQDDDVIKKELSNFRKTAVIYGYGEIYETEHPGELGFRWKNKNK